MIVRHRTPVTRHVNYPFGYPAGYAAARPVAGLGTFDRAFEQLTAGLFSTGATRPSTARVPDVVATWHGEPGAESLVLTVDLPGVSAESVSVEVAGRTLTLAAQTEQLQWSRSIQLGAALDPDSIEARHVDGRLTVHIAPVEAPATRSIAIDTTPMASIDTGATDQVSESSSGEDQPAA